jgi:chemotaxis protein histidine kinase CheA
MAEEVPIELLATFADESNEMAQEASRLVLQLERASPDQAKPLLEHLARTAHNLKGAAAAIGLDELSTLAHLVETVLEPTLKDGAPLRRHVADGILSGLDAIASHARSIASSSGDRESKTLTLAFQCLEALATAAEGDDRPSASDETPAAAALPDPLPARPRENNLATVRVLTSRLEAVMTGSEELYSLRSRLHCRAEEAKALQTHLEACIREAKLAGIEPSHLAGIREAKQLASSHFQSLRTDSEAAEATSKDLGENICSLRTVPSSGLLDALERLVRDHARRVGKEVSLAIEGRHIEVDRFLLEEIKAPLTHLVRNAVDHGIEQVAVRRAAGKPARGTIRVALGIIGDLLRVTIEDDGAGVSFDEVRRRTISMGLLTPRMAEIAPEQSLLDLLFTPGFSTAAELTETSGRGVGLDVVAETLSRLRGSVRIESQAGQGCRFTLEAPLAVAATHALVVRVGEEHFAVPTHAVRRVGLWNRDEIRVVRSQAYVPEDGQLIPFDRLGGVIGIAHPADPLGARFPVVILSVGSRCAAFVVHEYDDETELVVKPLADELKGMKYVQGVAVLGNGDAVLVLEPDHLVRAAEGRTGLPEPSAERGRYSVLVVDDSVTTRMLHQSALEAAGFFVHTAGDGEVALRLLSSRVFDAVVADVRMPKMSGLELSRAIRTSPRLKHLPLLLCTSLEGEEDQREAIACGATAFLPKSKWERGLLAQAVKAMLAGADA